jgi:flagellar hook-length control protein FliK
MSGVLAEGEPEEKDKGKLDLSLCLSGIPALYTQGAYQMQKAADAVTAGDQTLSSTCNQSAKDEVQGQSVGGSAAVKAGPIAPRELHNKPDAPAELAGFMTAKGSASKDSAVREPVKADAANAAAEPGPKAAKEKSELDQADFRNIQNPQTQSTAKAAQFMGIDPAREAVKPSSPDLGESAPVIRGMAALARQDKEKEKPVQIPAAGLVMARKAEQAIHAEGTQSAKDPAPENTVPEENAAIQVARASVHALRRGMAEYRVRLSPEGLGNVEVTVVTKGKAVTLSMRTDNEMARGLILDHADELRAELHQQNYQVSGLSVEVGTDGGNTAGFFTPREHAGTVLDKGRQITDQAAPDVKDCGNNADPRAILPRSSTISYRI